MSYDWRWRLIEDDIWWKTIFDGRQHLMEDDLWWKMSLMETFDGRQALCELRKGRFYAHVPIYIIYHSNTRYTVSFILPSRNIAINGIPAYTNTIKKSVYTEIGPINPKHGGLKSLKDTVQSYILVGHNKKLGFICKTRITSFSRKEERRQPQSRRWSRVGQLRNWTRRGMILQQPPPF